MINDSRLKLLEAQKVVIISEKHDYYQKVGTGQIFGELSGGNYGLTIKLDSGEQTEVLSKSEVRLLIDDSDAEQTIEQMIEDLAACNYNPFQIADYIDQDREVFQAKINDKDSKERFHYDKGRLSADFSINQKLLNNAKAGNLTSAQMYFKNADAKKVEQLKKKIFYGFET